MPSLLATLDVSQLDALRRFVHHKCSEEVATFCIGCTRKELYQYQKEFISDLSRFGPIYFGAKDLKEQKTRRKAIVLKLILPGGELYGLSRKEQLVRLEKDFAIKITLAMLDQWMAEFRKKNRKLAKIVEQLRQQEKDDLKEKVLSLTLPGGELSELTREEQKQRLQEDFGIQRSAGTLTIWTADFYKKNQDTIQSPQQQREMMKEKVLSLVMGSGELAKVPMSLQIERLKKEFGLKVPLTTLNRWKVEYRKKHEETSERKKVEAMKGAILKLIRPGGKLADLGLNTQLKRLEEDFGIKIGQTTLARWKKRHHISSQRENFHTTKKFVLELVMPNGPLFGLSGSEQMRRLQRDYRIKIGRSTFERWKKAYFNQSEEKNN